MKLKIHKNDTVLVLTGKDKGKRGRVFLINPDEGVAWVENVNQVKKAMRPKPNVRQAGIISREAPIQVSNLQLVCPACDKPTKVVVGPPVENTGATQAGARSTKSRTCKLCQAVIQ